MGASLLPEPFAVGSVLRPAVGVAASRFLVHSRQSLGSAKDALQQATFFQGSKALETSLIAASVSIVFFLAIFKTWPLVTKKK